MTGDGIPVPVPKGWTASSVESERYVNHNVEKSGTLSNLTFTSSGDYPWIQNASDGIWVSGNKGVANSVSELISNEFEVGQDGGDLNIEFSVNSFTGWCVLSGTLINIDTETETNLFEASGFKYGGNYDSLQYINCNIEVEEGKYTLSIKYTIKRNLFSGLDSGYVKSGTIFNYKEDGNEYILSHQYGGFVIYEGEEEVTKLNAWDESKNRNQFVWVPVKDVSRIYETNSTTGKKKAKLWDFDMAKRTASQNNDTDYKREVGIASSKLNYFMKTNLQGYTSDVFYKELESEFTKTIESIEKYGGFYIGRYETGNISSQKPVVRRLNSSISNEAIYNMYVRIKNISSNENIQTNIIWGCLWDETLEWIVETGDKSRLEIVQAPNWGNYSGTKFSYTTTSGSVATKYSSSSVPTGSTERNKANNIYDLAGNVNDLTLESSNSTYYGRGGAYNGVNDSQSAAYRNSSNFKNDSSSEYYGFRAFFYIKL